MRKSSREDIAESGGDWLMLDLRDFPLYFQSAAEVQRMYGLSHSTVRKACEAGRVKAWQLGRDWIVYLPSIPPKWTKKGDIGAG